MKNMFVALVFMVSFSLTAQAQQPTPQLLKEPAGWAFERFALPPVFAPRFLHPGFLSD